MTQEQLIEIACRCGAYQDDDGDLVFSRHVLAQFAAQIARLEREACAQICDQVSQTHLEDAECEVDPELQQRFEVYAKHERRLAGLIRVREIDTENLFAKSKPMGEDWS